LTQISLPDLSSTLSWHIDIPPWFVFNVVLTHIYPSLICLQCCPDTHISLPDLSSMLSWHIDIPPWFVFVVVLTHIYPSLICFQCCLDTYHIHSVTYCRYLSDAIVNISVCYCRYLLVFMLCILCNVLSSPVQFRVITIFRLSFEVISYGNSIPSQGSVI
jgi:hypothetical protein